MSGAEEATVSTTRPCRDAAPLDAALLEAAQRVADEAPELTPEQRDQLAVLLHAPSAKASTQAA